MSLKYGPEHLSVARCAVVHEALNLRAVIAAECFKLNQALHLQSVPASDLRKVIVRLPEKRKSNSHGARPVHLIITMIKWIRTSRLSINNSLSGAGGCSPGSSKSWGCSGSVPLPDVFFFSTLVTGPRRSLSLKLSDTKVYEPQIRARLGNPSLLY